MTRFADYELVEQLQPGNHGTFHLARPPARLGLDDELVALKILDQHATDNELKRMAAELQVLVDLAHPRLVEVIDAGHDGGRLYYTTPYYREGSLPLGSLAAADQADPTAQHGLRGPVGLAELVGLVADAAEAAHALHEVGVCHRDIKPSNILRAGGRGFLADLGVANHVNAQFTTTGSSPVGTLSYADPRLIHGDPPGRASDIWSLGATLHAAVTGVPVLGTIPNTHLAAAIEYVLGAVARVDPGCPSAVAAVVARATQPDRANRYGTAAELAAELRSLAGLPLAGTVDATGVDLDDVSPLTRGDQVTPSAALAPYRQPVQVIGARSPAGHLNHPEARRCRFSGEVRHPDRPWLAERGPRPPLGVLLLDDGRSYVVRWDTVLGRQPEVDQRVSDGRAAPLPLAGDQTMSRAHLVIRLVDWEVTVTNLSTNGTIIEPATGGQRLLGLGETVPLAHADGLVVAGRRFVYHSHHAVGALPSAEQR